MPVPWVKAIIDSVLLFMSDPDSFWKLTDIDVKKRVQDALFLEGVVYDFDRGFGVVKLADDYLLIAKIASKSTDDHSLAPGTGFEPAT